MESVTIPTFIIIGVIKGGTSGLYWTLAQHPQIKPAKKKELVYFQGNNYNKNLKNYYQYFPKCQSNEITGEATPSYILYEKVAKRIKESLPNCKFIVMLRNPITRAYSQYYHMVRNYKRGLYPQPDLFEAMVLKELNNKSNYNYWMGKDMLKRGKYAEQLKIWFKYFPKNQFLIIKSEEYFKTPIKIYHHVLEFFNLAHANINKIIIPDKRKYPDKMKNNTYISLLNYFVPYNKELYQLIDRDMNWEK
jgi:hypothetical protein